MKKRMMALVLSLCMTVSLAACGGGAANPNTENQGTAEVPKGTLVIGTESLNGVFSPFFYTSAYDANVFGTVFESICELNEHNELVPRGGSITAEEVKDANGNVQTLYTVTVNKDMFFSDGKPVTIDDVIFAWHVYADPNYDGMSTLRTSLDIVGMQEYYYDDSNYSAKLSSITAEAEKKVANKEDFVQYLIDTNLEGWWDGELPGDLDGAGMTWADYLAAEGYDPSAIEEDPEAMLAMLADCEYEHYAFAYDAKSYFMNVLSEDYIAENLAGSAHVTEISGITKVDEYTATVLVNGANIMGDRLLAQEPIIPKHYYGEGYSKGNLAEIKTKNAIPMGSGPFVFQSFENNVVTLKANTNYYLGAPKLEYLKFQVVDMQQKLNAVIMGEIDITDPTASQELMKEVQDNEIGYSLVGFPGYGYIAVSAKRVPDIKVREGLMHLMTREQAVQTYYGELAQIIERPMTPTLGEYPTDAKEYWGYDPAKALECFKEAGYEQIDGKLVKDGQQLVVEVGIGSAASHPSTPILTQMANDMDVLGAKLIISDTDFSILSNRINNDDIDMWVLAWGNSAHCDLTQIFGSESTKPGGSNRTWVQDAELDKLMIEVMQTIDLEERRELVAKELDIIMSWATYMPVYQRKDLWVYNPNTVNLDTIPKNTSTYYNFFNEIHKIEVK